MGVQILITDSKFYNEFKNDVGFVSNLGDSTYNFTGCVMENVKVIRQLDISWNSESSDADPFDFDTTLNTITRNGGGNFLTDGVSVGDTFDLFNYTVGTSVVFRGQVQSVNSTVIVYTVISGTPISTGTGFRNIELKFDTFLTALKYEFGLIENGDSYDNESLVSGNDQGYYGSNIGFDTGGGVRDTNFQTLQRLGTPQGWVTGNCRARFVNNPDSPNKYVQRFEVEHEFMIVPYYLDGELTNLQNNIIPNLLNGNNTLKYVYRPEFRTVLSNPNTTKSVTQDTQLGSVAWFNENFNGFQNNYQVNSITYTEQPTLNSASGILVGSKTRVQMQVQKNNGNFVVGERVGVYVSYLPEQSEYQNTTLSDLKANFIYDNAFGNSGGSGFLGQDFITNLTVFSSTSNIMTLFFDVEYNPTQKAFLSSKQSQGPTYFLVGVELGDVTLPSGNSDRVIILADTEEYDDSPDIPDLMSVNKFDIYPHNQQIGAGGFYTDMVSWNEDGLVVDFNFDLNLNQNAFLNTLDFKLVAYNPTTDQFWELDSYSFSPATSIVSLGVQQIIDNTTRGYILRSGDQFNDVQISVGNQTAGIQEYNGRFAQKISWQDWISNLNVNTAFFNSSEPNNNLNDKASNYSLLNGFEIRLAIFSNISGVSTLNVAGVTDYLFLSPNITVYDYEKDGNPIPVWSCVIETFDAINNTNLGGAILSGVDTLFRVTWTSTAGPITSLAGLWGINRIEETGQQGYDITEMSSINLPKPTGQQLLKPSAGTLLDMQIVSGNVVMECLIDGSLISAGQNYNLSSRIQDDNIVEGKLTSPSDEIKDTSGIVETKQEAP